MLFKNFSLFISLLLLVPTQSHSTVVVIEPARPMYYYAPRYDIGNEPFWIMGGCLVALGALMGGVALYDCYKERQEKQYWENFWKDKSEEEVTNLIVTFVRKVEGRLGKQLKAVREAQSIIEINEIRCDLECAKYVYKAIADCESWLKGLRHIQPKNEVAHLMDLLSPLEWDLRNVRSVMKVYIDGMLNEYYESPEDYTSFDTLFDRPMNRAFSAPMNRPMNRLFSN